MKKKYILFSIIAIVVIALIAVCIWYFSPKTFLKGVSADEVASISVFNGSTGKSMNLDNPEEIKTIVENIQNIEMKRDNISAGYDGYTFSMTFKDKDGKTIDSFIVNSDDTIRDDPFFYRCAEGGLCYDYLKELEEKYDTSKMLAEFDPSVWGIELSVKNVTPKGLTIVFKQSGGTPTGDLSTGRFFVVQEYKNNVWSDVVYESESEIAFTSEALGIPKNQTQEWDIDWEWLYGELPAGQYRIGKEIMDFRATGDFDKAIAYVEFTIE